MLLCQYRGGNKQSRLFSVHHRLKGGPQGHFRLSVAHIPAQQSVHGYGFFHIRFDFGNGFQLVRRFFKGEAFLKLALQIRVRSIGIAVGNLPQGIETDQFLRQLGYGRGSFGLHALPVGTAHFGQFGRDALAAHIFVQHTYLVYRYKQTVAACILQQQIVPVHTVHQHGFHAYIAADTVHIMHYIIAAFNIGKILQFRTFML